MSQIIKAFTGVFIVMFLMATGTGILGAFLQTMQAQNFHGKVIDELENSDYARPVLEDAFQIAKQSGGTLEVLLYMENGSSVCCDSLITMPETIGKVEMAEVLLTYPLQLPFIGTIKNYQLAGYAR